MNRLILVGNGFDLAHGMKTSYKDFMLWLIKKGLRQAVEDDFFNSDIFSIEYNKAKPDFEIENIFQSSYFNNHIRVEFSKEKVGNISTPQIYFAYNDAYSFKIYTRSMFFFGLLSSLQNEKLWVNIEMDYYRYLKNIAFGQGIYSDEIEILNNDFELLKINLIEYLDSLQVPNNNPEIIKLIVQPSSFDGKVPNQTTLLSFNYTNLAGNYCSQFPLESMNVKYIPIHGFKSKGDKDLFPVIFGYGDEMDDDYKKIELKNNPHYLKYIKSFGYAMNYNYRNLVDFINKEEFEVYIMGHSCGLSDRVMLNTIFEHDNCKEIQIFYYENGTTNNFIDIYQNVSKHFNYNKRADMRRKIVPLTNSQPLPQS